jgi:hypothetical protein
VAATDAPTPVNPLIRLVNATVGRLLRWAGGQWASGADRARRQPALREALLSGMADAVAAADKLGLGMLPETAPLAAGQAAEARAAVANGQITDEALASVAVEFLTSAAYVFGHQRRDATWTGHRDNLRATRDRAAALTRSLEQG